MFFFGRKKNSSPQLHCDMTHDGIGVYQVYDNVFRPIVGGFGCWEEIFGTFLVGGHGQAVAFGGGEWKPASPHPGRMDVLQKIGCHDGACMVFFSKMEFV